jgi:hypothetical protein
MVTEASKKEQPRSDEKKKDFAEKPVPKENMNSTKVSDAKTPPPPPMPPKTVTTKPMPAPLTARYVSTSGVLFRLHESGPERLMSNDAIQPGDIISSMEGYVSELEFSDGNRMVIRGMARVALKSAPKPAFQLERGSVEIDLMGRPATIGIGADVFDLVAEKGLTGPSRVMLDYLPPVNLSDRTVPASVLVSCSERPIGIRYQGKEQRLPAGWVVSVSPGKGIGTPYQNQAVTTNVKTTISAGERAALDRLDDRKLGIPVGKEGILLALRDHMQSRNRDTRRVIVRTLAAVDAYSLLVDALADPNFPDNRQAAAEVFRKILTTNVQELDGIKQALSRNYPNEDVRAILVLLEPIPESAKTNPDFSARLISQLDSECLAIRSLAIMNLKSLHGKDLGFSATDSPSRRSTSVRLWRNFLEERK